MGMRAIAELSTVSAPMLQYEYRRREDVKKRSERLGRKSLSSSRSCETSETLPRHEFPRTGRVLGI